MYAGNPIPLSFCSSPSSVSLSNSDVPTNPAILHIDRHHIYTSEDENTSQGGNHSFESECLYNLNHQYAHWPTNGWENPPICIPEAWDVIGKCCRTIDKEAADFGHMLNKRMEKTLKAETAERIVHAAFQTSLVGGMLVYDFDISTLWKKISERKTSTKQIIDQLKPFAESANFQIDALFFHPELGMVVLECKSNDFNGGPNSMSNACEKAKKQAEKTIRRLRDSVQILTDSPCTVDISYVLCFPNADKTRLQSANEQCSILDQNDFTHKASFHKFWERRIAIKRNENGSQVKNLFLEDVNFGRFIVVVYGFRAAHFISSASNAMEIHRMISTMLCNEQSKLHNEVHVRSLSVQQTSRTLPPREINDAAGSLHQHLSESNKNSRETTIFLNSEQLKAYEMAKKSGNMIIFGPPGSGKTLLIMLLAKEAAEMAKPGQVLVIVPSNSLAKMYEQFFCANSCNQKRTIVINPRIGDMRKAAEVASEDDVFADEEFTGTWIPRSRPQPRGAIVAAVTVGRYCDQVASARAKVLLENRLHTDHYDFIQLKTVMRSTKNICDYYKQFQSPIESIVIGHNISGKNVEKEKVSNMKQACELIKSRIHQLLTVPLNGTTTRLIKRKDIAIIIAHEPVLSQLQIIKTFLDKNGIPNGSVIEQIEGCTDLVAVDSSTNILSFEWCVVFVIDASNCYYSEMLTNPIVPCSRAISCLVAISTVECKGHFWGCGKLCCVLLRSMSTPNYIASSAGRDTGLWGSWSPIAGLFHRAFLAIAILLLLIVPEIGIFFLSEPTSSQKTYFRIVGLLLFVINALLIFASQNTRYLEKPAHKFWAVRVLTHTSTIIGMIYIAWAYKPFWYSLFLIIPSLLCIIFFRLHAFGLAALEHPRRSSAFSTFTMCYLIYVIIPMLFTIVSAFFIGSGTYVLILSFFIPVWFHIITFICAGETLKCFFLPIASPKSVFEAIKELRSFLNKPNSLKNERIDRAALNYIRYVANLSEITKDCNEEDKDKGEVDNEFEDKINDVDDNDTESVQVNDTTSDIQHFFDIFGSL